MHNMKSHIESSPCAKDIEDATSCRLLTSKEAASHLGFTSVRTIQNLRMRGVGPEAIKLPSGAVRYTRTSLDAWAKSSKSEPRNELTWQALRKRERQAARKGRDAERGRMAKEAGA
jgi:predicted DNA-binding transcriptional regulator AlpA